LALLLLWIDQLNFKMLSGCLKALKFKFFELAYLFSSVDHHWHDSDNVDRDSLVQGGL
jgi:hypothetical protein